MKRRHFVSLLLSAAATGCLRTHQSSDEPPYSRRLPPAATSGFDHHDVAEISANGSLDVSDYAAPRSFLSLSSVAEDDLAAVVSFGERRRSSVAVGSFDAEATAAALESEGFSESGESAGFRIFGRDDAAGELYFGIDDEYLIRSSVGAGTVTNCAEVLDGAAETAYSSSEDFAALADGLGDGAFVSGRVSDGPAEEVARGKSVGLIDEDTAEVTVVRVYTDEEEADGSVTAVNVTVSGQVRRPTAEVDGRTVRVTGRVSTARL